MTVINTNISAISAQNSLRVSGLNQSTAMERLSTGIRINSAKDDAAGLAISTRMTANIRGISAAIRNANDGISLTQTAEGSLTSIGDNLQRIRELAVQAANSGNNQSDLSALNSEAAQLISEIDRVANNSTFNGIKLLDGSYKDQYLQVGAGNDSNDRIGISIGDARTARLGAAETAAISGSRITSGGPIAEGGVTVNGYNVPATTSDGVSFYQSEGSAIAKANALNAIATKTGVTAAATSSTYSFQVEEPDTGTGDYKFLLNGVLIKGSSQFEAPAVAVTNAELQRTANEIVAKINAQTSKTGVYAKADTATPGKYTLTADDGRNIVLSINPTDISKITGEAVNLTDDGWGATGFNLTGTITTTTPTPTIVKSVLANPDTAPALLESDPTGTTVTRKYQENSDGEPLEWALEDDGSHTLKVEADGNVPSNWATIVSSSTDPDDYAGVYSGTGDNAGWEWTKQAPDESSQSGGLDLFAMEANGSDDSVVIFGGLELSSDSLKGITLSGTSALFDTLGIEVDDMVVSADASAGAGVGSVNLSTSSGAQSALTTLDRAINAVTDMRASMGAYQNRLTAAIANLENTSMNLTASRSRILDTDYAKETTNLAKSQIIQQAATAMLAQANQSSQSVLALLK